MARPTPWLRFPESTRYKAGLLVLATSLLLFFSIISTTSAFFGPQPDSFQPSSEKRELFIETYQELKKGQLPDLSETLVELQGYPLAPYLEYQLFRNQLAYQLVDNEQLLSFLRHHQGTAFHDKLKEEWLVQLGSKQDWKTYTLVAGSQALNDPQLECYRLQAEGNLQGRSLSWLETSAQFWRDNQPLPSSCEPLRQSLSKLGFLSQDDYWQGALGLMRAGQTQKAWDYREHLSKEQRQFLDFWRRGRLNPANRLQAAVEDRAAELETQPELGNEVLLDLLEQHASSHPSQTQRFIQQLEDKELLTAASAYRVHELLAIRAAWRNAPDTLELFAEVPENRRTAEGREWFARTQLRRGNWQKLVAAIQELPEALSQSNEWRYWLAKAYLQSDQPKTAEPLLESLAQVRNYYGFLAARELGVPPQMNASPAPLNAVPLQALSEKPGIQRAGELYLTGFVEDARREWHHTLAEASTATWQQAAWLAQNWGWYDRSVNAIHNAGSQNALELRFPLAHLDQLRPLAKKANLDLALVLALIRKESLFNPEARSHVGALGLMQVMPTTGQQVSRQLQTPLLAESDLLKPEYNLPIGVHYLSRLMQRYQDNPTLAAAAYNAGPSRASKWQQQLGKDTDPRWVEQITYAETRDYVKSILAFREVYAWRLQQQQLQLVRDTPKTPES
ncbi:transglycosylase SLT domain-containing protein [Marinospirillum sp.]|uniref:lytic transglycosylase domain-containing protein n=1 Tax=Marinospirillum sp. TaxID=2183934 RepID=UPI00286FF594|nr:transglycosylase SLT domain-containing protein [Marinospirillum sp.]MDR9468864.1 transglycosylase SLT domain-containing protein [Marinospirillum sp.]